MLDYTGKTIGYLRIDAMIQPPNGRGTEYQATTTCCNEQVTVTQALIQRTNTTEPACCVSCYKARRVNIARERKSEERKRLDRQRGAYQTRSQEMKNTRVQPEVATAVASRRSETRERLARIASGKLPTAAGGAGQ